MSKWKIFLVAVFFAAETYSAGVKISEPFKGVRHYHRKTTVPRILDMHLIEIDLTDPDLRFKISPPYNPPENKVQTVRAYLTSQRNIDSSAKLAVNASFFAYDTAHPHPYCWNRGLVSSMGTPYSPWQSSDSGDENRPWPVFNISAANVASILDRTSNLSSPYATEPATSLYNAVSGSERIVLNGINNAGKVSYGQPTTLHPRTAIGYTADQRMFILIVDGRVSTHSLGMTSLEVADFMISLGVTNAVNWDGGGSTTLVFAEPTMHVVNNPSGGSERLVGASLCVFAGDQPYIPADKYIFADFEMGDMGTFSLPPGYSGSTVRINKTASATTAVSSEGYKSNWAQRLSVIDDGIANGGWFVRHISGSSAARSQNIPRPTKGFVGLWAKTSSPGVLISIAIDNTADVTADRGIAKAMVADSQWHLYEWNLEDNLQWEGWANGNGIIDTPDFTIDSIQFTSNLDASATIYIDTVAHNPDGSVHKLYTSLGDIQNDGSVNLKDFSIISGAWRSTKPAPAWNPLCDISLPRDDCIDIKDLTVLLKYWLQN